MTPSEIAREIAYPLTRPAMVLALLFFWLLLSVAIRGGLYGLFLLIVLLPAYCRYLMAILEARAHGRHPEPPTIEIFNFFDSGWALFPAVPISLIIWFEFFVIARGAAADEFSTIIAALPIVLFIVLMPASLAILAISRSPLASINPASIFAVIRRSMPGYLLVPILMAVISAGIVGLMHAGMPSALIGLAESYLVFLFCSLTGAVMFQSGMHLEVDIPEPVEPDPQSFDSRQTNERQLVANHAYGFISRGNREGGLRHIQQRIDDEADVDGAYQWFFDEMLRWGDSDAVLFFAQPYLSRLLRLDQDAAAIRLLTRCLYRNARFRPLDQDRELITQLLQKNHRNDLLELLQG